MEKAALQDVFETELRWLCKPMVNENKDPGLLSGLATRMDAGPRSVYSMLSCHLDSRMMATSYGELVRNVINSA